MQHVERILKQHLSFFNFLLWNILFQNMLFQIKFEHCNTKYPITPPPLIISPPLPHFHPQQRPRHSVTSLFIFPRTSFRVSNSGVNREPLCSLYWSKKGKLTFIYFPTRCNLPQFNNCTFCFILIFILILFYFPCIYLYRLGF